MRGHRLWARPVEPQFPLKVAVRVGMCLQRGELPQAVVHSAVYLRLVQSKNKHHNWP